MGLGNADEDGGPVTQVVCTLAERRYFYGVAALVNSLVRAGFRGTVVVGYRGEPPPWLGTLAWNAAAGTHMVAPGVCLRLVEVAGPWHLNNCKPHFIEQVMFDLYEHADVVYYFDTDIVIEHPWGAFAAWARGGVVMVLDVADSYMSPYHIYRHAWRALAAKQNRECREFTGYVNGGCIGIGRAHAEFARVWSGLMAELERDGADMRRMKNSAGKLEFARMDQDVLNATIMATEIPVALLGPDAMGMFPWSGVIMPHAMRHKKPWDRNYILDALRGFPPGRVHQAYWQFVDGPIRPYGALALLLKRVQLTIGRCIGLLHIRSVRDI